MKVMALTDAEKARILEISNSGLSKVMFGLGGALKGAAWATRKGTVLAAKGLRASADGIETAGEFSASKMEAGSEACHGKAEELAENAKLLKKYVEVAKAEEA